jgi:hypothetical protein
LLTAGTGKIHSSGYDVGMFSEIAFSRQIALLFADSTAGNTVYIPR